MSADNNSKQKPIHAEESVEEYYFGACPECLREGPPYDCFYMNHGWDHWGICPAHKVRWDIGSNLFSCCKDQSEDEFAWASAVLSEPYTDLNLSDITVFSQDDGSSMRSVSVTLSGIPTLHDLLEHPKWVLVLPLEAIPEMLEDLERLKATLLARLTGRQNDSGSGEPERLTPRTPRKPRPESRGLVAPIG